MTPETSTGSGAHAEPGDARAVALSLEQVIRIHFSTCFRHGLKPAQWQALRYFAEAPASERTVTAFARHRASTMGTASTTISTLVKKGFLARDYGTGVPRNRGLHLTETGRELLRDDPIQSLVAAIAALPAPERAQMAQTLETIRGHLQAEAASGATPSAEAAPDSVAAGRAPG